MAGLNAKLDGLMEEPSIQRLCSFASRVADAISSVACSFETADFGTPQ